MRDLRAHMQSADELEVFSLPRASPASWRACVLRYRHDAGLTIKFGPLMDCFICRVLLPITTRRNRTFGILDVPRIPPRDPRISAMTLRRLSVVKIRLQQISLRCGVTLSHLPALTISPFCFHLLNCKAMEAALTSDLSGDVTADGSAKAIEFAR